MKVSELGEFGLIALIEQAVRPNRNKRKGSWRKLIVGIGDDAAAWRAGNTIQLATTDTLVQDVHFNLKFATWEELGWKALSINLSDIAAMGGIPEYALVSLALPGNVETTEIVKFYRGMSTLAADFGVVVAGGNISACSNVVLTLTVLGRMRRGQKPLLRSTAKPGDRIGVTGFLGTAAAGLKMLSSRLQFAAETMKLLREAHLKPFPQIKVGQELLQVGVRTAIDISDGLVSDLKHICESSRVGAEVRLNALPVHPAVREAFVDCLDMALGGGEDYELLFTTPPEIMETVIKKIPAVSVIGKVTEGEPGKVEVMDETGNVLPRNPTGWQHFVSQPQHA